jgi:Leucine-rich repeat (LRR) protein
MRRFFQLSYAAGLLLLLLAGSACQSLRRLLNVRYHHHSTAIISNADLVGGTEIDTGRYVLLSYEMSSDVPHHSDSWYTSSIFIKLKTLAALPQGKPVAIPDAAVAVSAYKRSTWYFENVQRITGFITRLDSTAAGYRLRLDLHYTSRKGIRQKLVTKSLRFRHDRDYFKRHRVDYKGIYEDLRLALKEPAKVKSLDLVTYAIQYEKRNGRGSGPDTLYQRLGELYNLEELDLHLSNLKVLPEGFRNLKRLKKLNLGYNQLTSFPVLLFELDSLRELNLEWNRLDSIPATVARLRHLKVLNLDDNRLNRYPMAVNAIVSLQELFLSNANLRVIPDQIRQLVNLEVLNLDGFWNSQRKNRLQDIAAIGSLSKLRSLSIKENGTIEAIPPELYQLKELEELNLQANPIDSAGIDRSRFPKLIKLDL